MKTSNTFWEIAIGISDDTISALDFSVHSKKLVADALAALQRVFFYFIPIKHLEGLEERAIAPVF